jgi:hypothetical protein
MRQDDVEIGSQNGDLHPNHMVLPASLPVFIGGWAQRKFGQLAFIGHRETCRGKWFPSDYGTYRALNMPPG